VKAGDIVKCSEYGVAIILSSCKVPRGVPEEELQDFFRDPESWPTEDGWTVQLLEKNNKILSIQSHCLESISG